MKDGKTPTQLAVGRERGAMLGAEAVRSQKVKITLPPEPDWLKEARRSTDAQTRRNRPQART